jgi:hypothetical protein
MICTGTGSAPMRAMTEWRRRLRQSGKFEGGKLMLFFGARTQKELRNSLRTLTELTQSDARKGARAERAQALSACIQNPRMEEQMGRETQRLTDAIADVTNEVKNKGLFRKDVDSKTLATFIQAYSLGKIVNDYNPTGVSEEQWVEFIMKIIDHTFMTPIRKE